MRLLDSLNCKTCARSGLRQSFTGGADQLIRHSHGRVVCSDVAESFPISGIGLSASLSEAMHAWLFA